MSRTVFIGSVGAGKTTLFNALQNEFDTARKTQAIEFSQDGDVDTPGEYFSHPRLYHALINTLIDCDLLIYVHAANDAECRIPAGLLDIYPQLHRIAVITKVDARDADVAGVEEMLLSRGFETPILAINALNRDDIEKFKVFLAAAAVNKRK